MQGELQETQLKNTVSELLTSKKASCVYCCRVNAVCKSHYTLLLHYSKDEKMVMENFKLYQKCKLLAHGNTTDLDFLFPHI